VMRGLEAHEKYELWTDYLTSEVWFDGKNHLFFAEPGIWTPDPEKEEGLSLDELFSDEDDNPDFDLPF